MAFAVFLRRGSGYSRIASLVMGVMRAISCFWPKNVAKVPPLLNLMPIEAAKIALAHGKNGRYVPVFGGKPAVYQPACDHKLCQGSERMQGHHLFALVLSVAAVAGCRAERPLTAPTP